MRGSHHLLVALLATCFIPPGAYGQISVGQPDSFADVQKPSPISCEGTDPAPGFAKVERTPKQILSLTARPRTQEQLLETLRVIFAESLLSQPGFYQDAVVRKFFDVDSVSWRTPAEWDTFGDRVVRPSRIATTTAAQGTDHEFTLELGHARRCFAPETAGASKDARVHAYDSGFIRLALRHPSSITVGDVKRRFGSEPMELILLVAEGKGQLRYELPWSGAPGVSRPWVTAEFFPQQLPGVKFQINKSGPHYPDTALIERILIRVVEEDPAFPEFRTSGHR
jgi:hypothetical protein